MLPLTGDNVAAQIQSGIQRPVFISSEMANNTFLRDWLQEGEQDPARVQAYLQAIERQHSPRAAFVVSARTGRYYGPDGLVKTMSARTPQDAWFYRVQQLSAPYELNVDVNPTYGQEPLVFVNYRLLAPDGTFLAATGVGLTLENVQQLLRSYDVEFQRHVYFLDAQGRVVLDSRADGPDGRNIREQPGLKVIADALLSDRGAAQRLTYRAGGAQYQVNARFIPELRWFLVVEQNETRALAPLRRVLLLSALIGLVATTLVLAAVLPTVARDRQQLRRAALTDPLTGLKNRAAFDAALAARREEDGAVTLVLFDLDHFKAVNDRFGHPAGDEVLRRLAHTVQAAVRRGDLLARWGGEEFILMIEGTALEGAAVAQKVRAAVADMESGVPGLHVTVSVGVASLRAGDAPRDVLTRADEALYRAKQGGRNRVDIASEADMRSTSPT
nr:sensor domain-containing diguanylate cyclase [Deinococcus betulae]